MKAGYRIIFSLLSVLALSDLAEAGQFMTPARQGHFFLPSRTLFFFRPDLYFQPYYRSYSQPYYRSQPAYPPPICHTVDVFGSRPRQQTYLIIQPVRSEIVQANAADLIFNVRPARAQVYIDDKLIGSAGDFATERDRYTILDGQHVLRIEHPRFRTFQTDLEVVSNRTLHLEVELEPLTEP